MRAAHILGSFPDMAKDAIKKMEHRLREFCLNENVTLDQMLAKSSDIPYGMIDVIDGDTGTNILISLLGTSQPFRRYLYESCFLTKGTAPHVDEDIEGNFTLGLVLIGDHWLFTGNHRFVGTLKPGTLFLLNNKKMHGAAPNLGTKEKNLLFLSVDFDDESSSISAVLKRLELTVSSCIFPT